MCPSPSDEYPYKIGDTDRGGYREEDAMQKHECPEKENSHVVTRAGGVHRSYTAANQRTPRVLAPTGSRERGREGSSRQYLDFVLLASKTVK